MSDSSADRFPLVIVGASTRAAAASALRAGFSPLCADLFADFDLQSFARVVQVSDYSHGLAAAIESFPDAPWMYVGGIENHPETIRQIGSRRRLLGNGPQELTYVRNPHWVASTLAQAGLPTLKVWPDDQGSPPQDGTWMYKPRRGAGGRAISIWDSSAQRATERSYFQQYRPGPSYSAQFLALPGRTVLLGCLRQLVGLASAYAPAFAWCGAMTAEDLAPSVVEMMHLCGTRLAEAANLRGLFGCDFQLADGLPWLTEVNPRYTGSMELIETRLETSLVGWHVRACLAESPRGDPSNDETERLIDETDERLQSVRAASPVLGKLILFARCDSATGDTRALLKSLQDPATRQVADLPWPGQLIRAGQPVCTLFASGPTEAACLTKLEQQAAWFQAQFLSVCW